MFPECISMLAHCLAYLLPQGHFSHVYKGEYTDDQQRTQPVNNIYTVLAVLASL